MRKKIIPTLVAVVLIIIIASVAFGENFIESITYSSQRVDLDDYFNAYGNQLAIILQDEMVEEKAILHDGRSYFDLETVHAYFDKGFYIDEKENLLLYTAPADIFRVNIGGSTVESENGVEELEYVAAMKQGKRYYVADAYLERFVDCSVELFEQHVQVYTEWEGRFVDTILKDTALRLEGSPKSAIICDLPQEAKVELLSQGEEWSKVKTDDAMIGFVENKRLSNVSAGQESYEEAPKRDFIAPEYTSLSMDGKLVLGWHLITNNAANANLDDMIAGTSGMNVIAPTWFSLNDEDGGFRNLGSSSYVEKAHSQGLMVWGVWDDFNANAEKEEKVDVLAALRTTSVRQQLVESMIQTALELGLDGINVDFESVTQEDGAHFVQFIRELSVGCRKNELFLSVDNYVPYDYRSYYGIDVQGLVADYVIIMGYDEHWHGSGDPGSVASINYVSEGITRTLNKEVPARKVVNALPFYTRIWISSVEGVRDIERSIRNMDEYLREHDVTYTWDEETCQNYAEWIEGEDFYQVWLEDEESIAVKLNVMSVQNIGGVGIWRLGFGTPQVWELIREYAE